MKAPTVSESISNSPTILPASRIRTTSSERVWIEQARYSYRPRAHPRRSGHAHLRPPRRRRPPRLTVSPRSQSTEEGRGAARDPGLFNRIHRSAWRNRLINRLGTHERPRSIARKVPKGGFWHRLGLPRGSTVSLFWNYQIVSGREILGSPKRSKSQPLAPDPRYNHSYRSGFEAKIRFRGGPMPLGAELSGRACYVELPRIPLMSTSSTELRLNGVLRSSPWRLRRDWYGAGISG